MAKGVTYHFECQYTNDGTMAFRMWEYDVILAVRDHKLNEGRMEFDFPRSCVIYVARNGNYPKDGLELKINFQDGQSIIYKVPSIRLQDYGLDEINHKKLWLFYPFMALQFVADMKGKKHLPEQEVLGNYEKMISCIEDAYNNNQIIIDENATLLEAIQKTNRYAMKDYQVVMEGVESMVSQTLELKHRQIAREAAQTAGLSMLMEMKTEGMPKQAIIRIAKRQNISEDEVNKIFDSQ